ncbi:hypothetical protein D039_1098A, partial [Vibrio parahaemolyticus EKP-028]
MSHQHT